MKFIKQTFAFCLLLIVSPISWSAENNISAWKLEIEEGRTKVHSRKVQGFEIDEIKGTTEIKTTVGELIALYLDFDQCALWAVNCDKVTLIEELSENELNVYREIDNPWPVSNRDYYLHINLSKNTASGETLIKFEDIKSINTKNKGFVRSKMVKGFWKFAPSNDGLVEVTYQVHLDPGGDLSASLINSGIKQTPIDIFTALKEKLEKSK